MITFKQYLSEARMAPLYHATRLSNYQTIMKENQIDAGTYHQHDRTIKQNKPTVRVVSLTRDIRFAMRWGNRKSYGDYVILELDQQKLIQKYKLVPYNHFQDDEYTYKNEGKTRQLQDVKFGGFPVNQYEENVIGDIKPLSKYLVRVHYPPNISSRELDEIRRSTPTGIEITGSLIKKHNIV